MKQFEKYSGGEIVEGDDGIRVYYPWAIFGKGFVVETDEVLKRILQHKRSSGIISLILIVVCVLISPIWLLIYFPVHAVWHYFSSARATKGLSEAPEKITYPKFVHSRVKILSYSKLFLMLFAFIGGFMFGIYLLMDEGLRFTPILITVGCLLFMPQGIYMLLVKRKQEASVRKR